MNIVLTQSFSQLEKLMLIREINVNGGNFRKRYYLKQTYILNVFIFSFVSYSATLSKRDQLYDNFRVTILHNKIT